MVKAVNNRITFSWYAGFGSLALALMSVFVYSGCDTDPPPVKESLPQLQTPQASEGIIVAVGNSLTAGLGIAEEMTYPALLAQKLKAGGYHYQVINAGVSGETSSGARSRIEWVVTSLKPDIVILETGANDGLRGIDPRHLESNLDQICSFLKGRNIQVLLAGMKILPNLGPDYIQAFSSIYPRVAQKHQVVFMPFFLKDVAGDTTLNQPDRIHPTAQGYERITKNIYPYVLEAIKRHRNAN